MKSIQFLLFSFLIIFSLQNKLGNDERLLPLACERIVENFKIFGNLDKLDNAITDLFRLGIVDEYTESISKWLLAYQFKNYNDKYLRIISIENDDYFGTAHYEYVTEDILRENIKTFISS